MKKWLLFLIPVVFLLMPKNANAEVLDILSCNSDSAQQCSMLSYSSASYVSSSIVHYPVTKRTWLTDNIIVPSAVINEVEIGPPAVYPGYVYKIDNIGLDNSYYSYNFEKDKIYSLTYTLQIPTVFDINFYPEFAKLNFSGRVTGTSDFSDDVVDTSQVYYVKTKDDAGLPGGGTVWAEYEFSIEFKPTNNIDRLRFEYGSDETDEVFNFELDSLFANSETYTPRIYIVSLSVTEISEFSTGGHGNVSDSDDSGSSVDDKLDDLNDNITNSDTSGSQDIIGGFFDGFQSNDHGLSSIITAPLEFIRNLLGHSCQPLTFDLPFVDKEVSLPCIKPIYQQYFGLFFNLYQVITTGVIAYAVGIRIFGIVKGLQDPQNDKIEVLKL